MVNANKIRINIKSTSESTNTERRERSPVAKHTTSKSNYRDRSVERSKSSIEDETRNHLENINHSGSGVNKQSLGEEGLRDSRGRSRERNKDFEVEVEEESDGMLSLMGFSGFGTTKGKHVTATKGGSAKKEKSSDYRQYMNRTKGFNRPLSPKRNK